VNGYVLIFAAAVLWGLIGVFSQGVLDAGVGALEIAFWRAALAGALFAVHARLTGQLKLAGARDFGFLAGFAGIGVTLFYAAYTLAVQTGGVSLASLLLYSAPAFVALAAWALLGEALTPTKLGLLALTLTGVVLVSQGGGEGVRVGPSSLFWGLTAALSYASYYIFGKWVLARYAPVTIYAVILPIGALGLLPFVSFAPKPPSVWGLLLLLAVFSTYAAYGLYYTGLKQVEASRAVLVASIEPVVAALFAALFFGERLSVWGLAGGAAILSAAVLASLPARGVPHSPQPGRGVRLKNGGM
jgi:DME family drug/metabolite transporter